MESARKVKLGFLLCLFVCVAFASPPARAQDAGAWVFVNTTGGPVSDLHGVFEGTGGDLTGVVVADPTGIFPPVGGPPPPSNEFRIDWAPAAIPPGAAVVVEFATVHGPLVINSAWWTDVGGGFVDDAETERVEDFIEVEGPKIDGPAAFGLQGVVEGTGGELEVAVQATAPGCDDLSVRIESGNAFRIVLGSCCVDNGESVTVLFWSTAFGADLIMQDDAWNWLYPKAWTVLVFLNGANNLEAAGIDDFGEMAAVGSDDERNIVVQFDRVEDYDASHGDWTGTLRFYVETGDVPTEEGAVHNPGEQNMGDGQALVDFAIWAMRWYPADHYLLVIWNHGWGWGPLTARGGFCDEDNDHHFLETNEVRDAVAAIRDHLGRKIDIVGFDACLMQMVEVVYPLRDYCDYIVGSEESEPNDGWNYEAFLPSVSALGTAEDICAMIVLTYCIQPPFPHNFETQSAIRTNGLENLKGKVNALAQTLMDNWGAEEANIHTARENTSLVTFDYGEFGPRHNSNSYVDLGHLCQLLEASCESQAVKDAAADVRTALGAMVVEECFADLWYEPAEGLSIYFPDHCPDMVRNYCPYNPPSYYDYYANYQDAANLDFVAETVWEDFLNTYLGGASTTEQTSWGAIKSMFR